MTNLVEFVNKNAGDLPRILNRLRVENQTQLVEFNIPPVKVHAYYVFETSPKFEKNMDVIGVDFRKLQGDVITFGTIRGLAVYDNVTDKIKQEFIISIEEKLKKAIINKGWEPLDSGEPLRGWDRVIDTLARQEAFKIQGDAEISASKRLVGNALKDRAKRLQQGLERVEGKSFEEIEKQITSDKSSWVKGTKNYSQLNPTSRRDEVVNFILFVANNPNNSVGNLINSFAKSEGISEGKARLLYDTAWFSNMIKSSYEGFPPRTKVVIDAKGNAVLDRGHIVKEDLSETPGFIASRIGFQY